MILVVGVAGSGKSTQSKMLGETEGWHWVSMGQLLRGTLTGDQENVMNSGKMLNDSAVYEILLNELSNFNPKGKVILDGFPRRVSQAQWLLDSAQKLGDKVEAIIHINAQQDIVLQRLLERGRQDDRLQAINERFLEYEQDIKPLLQLFSTQKIPIIEVNGEQSSRVVHAEICTALIANGVIV